MKQKADEQAGGRKTSAAASIKTAREMISETPSELRNLSNLYVIFFSS